MIPDDRDLNTVTALEWRTSTLAERIAFIERERRRGCISAVCLNCGFPTVRGQSMCEACW